MRIHCLTAQETVCLCPFPTNALETSRQVAKMGLSKHGGHPIIVFLDVSWGKKHDQPPFFLVQAETWTLLSISGSPSARFLHSAVLEDPEIPRMWVFGGSDGFSSLVKMGDGKWWIQRIRPRVCPISGLHLLEKDCFFLVGRIFGPSMCFMFGGKCIAGSVFLWCLPGLFNDLNYFDLQAWQ